MKFKFSKVISLLLALVMLVSAVPVFNIGVGAANYFRGDIVEFGSYPQSKVTDTALISELDKIEKSWVSYGYYSGNGDYGSMQQSDYMRYADISYNGERYRAVIFDNYRPYYTTSSFPSADKAKQYKNGFETNQVYYFKFEPIEWYVVSSSSYLVLQSKDVIDAQAFNDKLYESIYYSDWETGEIYYRTYHIGGTKQSLADEYSTSSLREWLNNEFYNTAFNPVEKYQMIKRTIQQLSDKVYSTGDISPNMLPGVDYDDFEDEVMKYTKSTDYAKVQGVTYYEYNGYERVKCVTDRSYEMSSQWLGIGLFYTIGADYYYGDVEYPNAVGGIYPVITIEPSTVLTAKVTSGVKTGCPVNVDVKTVSSPTAIRFVNSDNEIITILRDSVYVNSIKLNNDSTEIWNVTVPFEKDQETYKIYVKYSDTGWMEEYTSLWLVSHPYDTTLYSTEVAGNEDGVIYQGVSTLKVKTGLDVIKVQLMKDGNTWTYSNKNASYVDEDGVRVWTINMNFSQLGDHSYNIRVRTNKTTFELTGHSVDVTVYAR